MNLTDNFFLAFGTFVSSTGAVGAGGLTYAFTGAAAPSLVIAGVSAAVPALAAVTAYGATKLMDYCVERRVNANENRL